MIDYFACSFNLN